MEKVILVEKLHKDIETGRKRMPQTLYVEVPEQLDSETGLILFINGFNTDASEEYQRKVLKPYLAEKYNCVVLDTTYFGLRKVKSVLPTQELINNFNAIYSADINMDGGIDEVFQSIMEKLSSIGCSALDLRCQFKLAGKEAEYESWGLLPAIDLLNFTGQLISEYGLNRRRVIAYGMSYGGYVAKLLGKFAPNTFAVIIDKAGFSRVKLKHVLGHELMKADYSNVYPAGPDRYIRLSNFYDNPWTIMKKGVPFYFSDAHRAIRSLLTEKHRMTSETRYYVFHSIPDDIAPIGDCDREMEMLKRYNRVHYERVDANMIGRSIFKSDRHDLSVSTRGLFDHVAGLDKNYLYKTAPDNDFSMQSVHRFDCGDREYVFSFGDDGSMQADINKK